VRRAARAPVLTDAPLARRGALVPWRRCAGLPRWGWSFSGTRGSSQAASETAAMAAADLPVAADGAPRALGCPRRLSDTRAGGAASASRPPEGSGPRPAARRRVLLEPSCPLCKELEATTFRDPGLTSAADRRAGAGALSRRARLPRVARDRLAGVRPLRRGRSRGEHVRRHARRRDAARRAREGRWPELAPVPWRPCGRRRALREAEIARDAHERDGALDRAKALPLPLAAAWPRPRGRRRRRRPARCARCALATSGSVTPWWRGSTALAVERGAERDLAAVRGGLDRTGLPASRETR
jgi:hypothetical protein